jgi:hypothetical protein
MIESRSPAAEARRPASLPDLKGAAGTLAGIREGISDLAEGGSSYNPIDGLAMFGALTSPADAASFRMSLERIPRSDWTRYADLALSIVRRGAEYDPISNVSRSTKGRPARSRIPDYATLAENYMKAAGLAPESDRDRFLDSDFRRFAQSGGLSTDGEWPPFLEALGSVKAGRRGAFVGLLLPRLRDGHFKGANDYQGIADAYMKAEGMFSPGTEGEGIAPIMCAMAEGQMFRSVGDLRGFSDSLSAIKDGRLIPMYCRTLLAIRKKGHITFEVVSKTDAGRYQPAASTSERVSSWAGLAACFEEFAELVPAKPDAKDNRGEALARLAETSSLNSERGWMGLLRVLRLLPKEERTADYVGWELPERLRRHGTWRGVADEVGHRTET